MKTNDLYLKVFKGDKKGFLETFSENDCILVDKYNQTLLQEALLYGINKEDEEDTNRYDIAKFLIEHRCNIDHQDDDGQTALHYILSAKDSRLNLINDILNANPNINLEDKHGNQPLWTAVLNAKVPLSIIKKLLEKGADPHHKNNVGKSPYDMVKQYNIKELNEIFEPYV